MSKESSIKVFAENASGTRPANAIPVWIDNISAIGGSGGSDFDPTFMSAQIDNKLNTSAFSSVSGNFQPKSAMSNYVTNSDLDYALYIESETINLDKVSNSAVGFYKTWGLTALTGISGKDISAKSAYNASRATVANTAQTAYYDANGNNLTQTHNELTALNEFVHSNSASWGQGGGADVTPLGLWLGYEYNYPKAINNTNDVYRITLRHTMWQEPPTIYYDGNSYSWNGTNGDWYIDLTDVIPNDMRAGLPYNNPYETKYTVMEFTNTNTQQKYSADIYINDEQDRGLVVNDTACVVSARGDHASFNVDYADRTGIRSVSSWQGTNDYVSGGFTNSQATAFLINASQEPSTAYVGFAREGSTVASSDVFPPTNNLDPYSTYYLGWNANNGGLFWYQPGNSSN